MNQNKISNKFQKILKKINDSSIVNSFKDLAWPFQQHKVKQLQPIFIVGCGHSGTSIILAIIGSHSQIHTINYESQIFYRKSRLEMGNQLLTWQFDCWQNNKKYFLEKTPKHILKIPEIWKFCPQAKIILMLRDGRDVVCSLKNKGDTIETAIDTWINRNLFSQLYWQDARLKVVRLETLITNTETTLKEIFNFLNLEYESHVLEFYKTPRYYYSPQIYKPEGAKDGEQHLNLRNWQINQPLFETTARWEQEMNEEDKNIFKNQAQKYLVEWGYAQDDNW